MGVKRESRRLRTALANLSHLENGSNPALREQWAEFAISIMQNRGYYWWRRFTRKREVPGQ